MNRTDRRATIDAINGLNAERLAAVGDPEIATRISQYEMAFRMQRAAPELIDLSSESRGTLAMYGAHEGEPSLAVNLLQARRLVERGVRFVTIYHEGWDGHSDVAGNVKNNCATTDRASAALVARALPPMPGNTSRSRRVRSASGIASIDAQRV
jgi:hypothetical protein